MTTRLDIARDARVAILEAVEEGAKRLLLTPGLGNGVRQVALALDDALGSYEALVRAAHTSSSEQYALRDLPPTEKASYANAQHLIKSLRTLHATEVIA